MREPFVELAKDCVRTCHVLKSVTEGKDANNFSGSDEKRIEDLERCVNPAQSSLQNVTSGIRIMHQTKSLVSQRAGCARDSQERHPEPIEKRLIAWRMEMLEILRVFDVRGQYPSIATVSELPQARGDGLEIGEIRQPVRSSISVEPSPPAFVMVRCPLATAGPPPANRPPDVGFVSGVYC